MTYVIYRQNGDLIEITEIQKKPREIHVRNRRTRELRTLFRARRQDNIRRTRQICVRRVSAGIKAFGSPLLVTLTFGGDASNASYANDAFRVFQVRLRNKFPTAVSLFVPELSRRGRIHFHGLVFNLPMSLGDSRRGGRVYAHGEERTTRTLAKLWRKGFVDVRKTDGSGKLASYVSKYITKGGGETLFNAMRIVRVSGKFPKEVLEHGEEAEDLARPYATLEPIREWNGDNIFLGKITKRTYIKP
jgi:hypothetical protein